MTLKSDERIRKSYEECHPDKIGALLREIEALKERVRELEDMLKQRPIHYVFVD